MIYTYTHKHTHTHTYIHTYQDVYLPHTLQHTDYVAGVDPLALVLPCLDQTSALPGRVGRDQSPGV